MYTYQSIIEKFPNDPLAVDAQYQIGYIWSNASRSGNTYDPNAAAKAKTGFEDFLYRHPNSEKSAQARENLKKVEHQQTSTAFEIARYYDKQKSYRAAAIYYNDVIRQQPDSREGDQAKKRISELRVKLGDEIMVGDLKVVPTAVEQIAALPPVQRPKQPGRAHPDALTEREVEVLRLIATGKTTKQIATLLVVSVPTVERHITHIYDKIGARSRASCARVVTSVATTIRPPGDGRAFPVGGTCAVATTATCALYPGATPLRSFIHRASGSLTFPRGVAFDFADPVADPRSAQAPCAAVIRARSAVCVRNARGRLGGGGSSSPVFCASNCAIASSVRLTSFARSASVSERSAAAFARTLVPSTTNKARSTNSARTATSTLRASSTRIPRRCRSYQRHKVL
jgi:DNA-binding CsgD family transcriptional regulator